MTYEYYPEIEIYRNRMTRVFSDLSDERFAILNKEGAGSLSFAAGGCLDAPEQLPAGSVYNVGKECPISHQCIVGRCGVSKIDKDFESLDALAEKLINEIIAELESE